MLDRTTTPAGDELNSRDGDRLDSRRRGQTNIDFVVGMSVFLLTVAFVVAFLPSVFEPFTDSNAGDALVADRTAGLLAEQLLAEPSNPAVLDAACTREFFDSDGATGGCPFDADAGAIGGALGVGANTHVNVTVEEDGTIQAIGEDGAIRAIDAATDDVDLRAGDDPPETQSVVVARRVVWLGGEERDLYVRIW